MDQDAAEMWFYTNKGERCGPVPFEELKAKVDRTELDPLTDLVWKKGMPAWKLLGEVRELHIGPPVAQAPPATLAPPAAAAMPSPTFAATPQPIDPLIELSPVDSGQEMPWPGARRRSYLFMMLVFPALWLAGYAKVAAVLSHQVGNSTLSIIGVAATLLPVLFCLLFTLMRFSNLGMSRWWILGKCVPLLNLWVDYRLFACPAGYASHRKMDGPGIMLAILYWLLVVVGIAIFIGMMVMVFWLATDPSFQQQLRDAIGNQPELQQALDQFLQKVAPPPSDP